MIIFSNKTYEIIQDGDAFWLLNKCLCVRADNKDLDCFPSIDLMCKDTGFGRGKVIKALNYLEDKKIIKIKSRVINKITNQIIEQPRGFKIPKGMANFEYTSSVYSIIADESIVSITGRLKVNNPSEIGLTKEEEGQSQNETEVSSEMKHTSVPESATNLQVQFNSTTSSKNQNLDLEELNNFIPNEMYSQTIARTCPDLDQLAIETELLLFKTYYQKNIPENLDGKFLKWCQNSNEEYRKRKTLTKINDKDFELKDKRIEEFHEKKMENIAKIGTQSNFKPPYQTPANPDKQPASFDLHPQISEPPAEVVLTPEQIKEKEQKRLEQAQKFQDMKRQTIAKRALNLI